MCVYVCLYVLLCVWYVRVCICTSLCMYVCMVSISGKHSTCSSLCVGSKSHKLSSCFSCLSLREDVVKKFCYLLQLVGNFSNNSASHHLTAHMLAAAHMILKLAPPTESEQTVSVINVKYFIRSFDDPSNIWSFT